MKRREFLKTIVILPVVATIPAKAIWTELGNDFSEAEWVRLTPLENEKRKIQALQFTSADLLKFKGPGNIRELYITPLCDSNEMSACTLRYEDEDVPIMQHYFSQPGFHYVPTPWDVIHVGADQAVTVEIGTHHSAPAIQMKGYCIFEEA